MLDGKEAMPENGTCPEPDKELAPFSRNQPKVKNNNSNDNKTRTGTEVSGFPKQPTNDVEIWAGVSNPPPPKKWYTIRQVHSSTEFSRIILYLVLGT